MIVPYYLCTGCIATTPEPLCQKYYVIFNTYVAMLIYSSDYRKGKTPVGNPESTHEREEVFYTIPLQGRRRHSVGGYLATGAAGHGEITTVPSEVPKMPPPKFGQKEDETVKRRKPKNFPFKGKFHSKIIFYRIYVRQIEKKYQGMLKSVMWSLLTQAGIIVLLGVDQLFFLDVYSMLLN